jgi:hypothetical protein
MGQFILKLHELNYIFKYYIPLLCQFIFPVQFALWLYIVNTTNFLLLYCRLKETFIVLVPAKAQEQMTRVLLFHLRSI